MKQIDYLRKSRKICSALLMACALTFMLLTTTLSFAQTNSLTLGCPTRNGNNYQYAALSLTAGDGVVRSISISFSENPDGCSISLPSTSWTVSGNEYSRYIIPAEGATSAQIQAFLQGVTFNVPNGTLKGVNIILSIDDASRQIFYFAGNGHYYEYVPYDGTKTWTIAYNEAKGKEYCGRPGYLATLTTADEDAFVTRIVQNAMWIGGTRLSPTDDATSTGTQYYANFDTDDEVNEDNTDYWYWACGPEKGARITNEGAITNSNEQLSWYTQQPREPNGYTNWMYAVGRWTNSMYSAEPNNSGNESCLTVLRLGLYEGGIYTRKSENTSTTIGNYVFGWNDVTYEGNNTSSAWRPQGYLVEYGDQSIGHSQTDEACSISASGLVGNATRTITATLSGSTAVCAGEEATLNIIFEDGAFPFTGSVQGNNGEVVHTFNTNDISYNFTVAPTATTSYTISTFSDASSTTGSNGCSGVYNIVYEKSGSVTVTVNNPQVALNDIESVAICAGASTTLTATTTGTVTDNVAYAWSTGATGSEITVTPSATTTYTVTATATQGECTATATKEVTVRVNTPQVALKDIASVAICAGASTTLTAELDGTPTGNVAYAWSIGATENEITVTPSETTTYTVTATATQGGCAATATKEVTVTVNELPTATVSVTDVKCNGAGDGIITVNANGGSGSYQYQLGTGTFQASNIFAELAAGDYTLTVKDGNSCTTTATTIVAEPAQLTLTEVTATDETCKENNDGTISYTVGGGTPNYTITFAEGISVTQNAAGTYTQSDLSAGDYVVKVVDHNGCSVTAPAVTIDEPATLVINQVGNIISAQCKGDNNGQFAFSIAGGNGTNNITINGGAVTLATPSEGVYTQTGLAAGTYTVSVTDNKGCSATKDFVVGEPDAVLSATVTSTQESCAGNDGTATVAAAGGNGGYTFAWSNDQSSANATRLSSFINGGVYTVTVTDAKGCKNVQSVTITLNNPLAMAPITGPAVCTGTEFSITPQNGTNGTIPAGTTYSWPAPDAISGIGGLAAGTDRSSINGVLTNNNSTPQTVYYTVTPKVGVCVGNAVGVSVTVTTTVNPNVTIDIPHTMTVCSNADTSLSATFVNSVSNSTVVWKKNGITMETHTVTDSTDSYAIDLDNDICKGQYTYRVEYTDESGCTASDECVITVNAGDWSISQPAGTATIECVSDTTEPAESLLPVVEDGCGRTTTRTLLRRESSPTPITCTGTVTYTYRYTACDDTYKDWTYTYTINDVTDPTIAADAITTKAANIDQTACKFSIPDLTADIRAKASDNCTADLVITQKPEFGTEITAATDVVVTVTDKCGNSTTDTVNVTVPTLPTATIAPTHILCHGNTTGSATVTPTNGTAPYTYLWSNSQTVATATKLDNTEYTVTVTDANGCSTTASVTITEPELLQITSITPTNITCPSGNDGKIEVAVTGGTTPYSYQLNGGDAQSSAIFETLTAGNYTVTVTDANGCSTTSSTTLTQPAPLALTGCPTNITKNTDEGESYATVTWTEPTFSPIGNGATLNVTGNTATNRYSVGTTTITYTVTNTCGESQSCSFTITVSDNQAPVITCAVNGNQDVLPNSAGNTYTHSGNSWDATATDNVDVVSLTYTLTDATVDNTPKTTLDGQVFNYGTTTVTWKATDNTGASDVCSFQVVVADNTNPVLTCPTITTVYECLAEVPATYANYAAFTAADGTATDNHQINESSFAVTETVTPGCPTTITRTYSIKDMTGNEGTCTQVITVEDKTAPVLTGTWPANITGQNNCFANRNISGLLSNDAVKALYTDNCGGELTVDSSDVVTGDDCGWTVTRTYTIKDSCGNTVMPKPTMIVSGRDQTAPALIDTWPANITGQNNCLANRNISGLYSNDQVKALYSDCSALTVTSRDTVTGDDCGWTVTRTYTITDACNNSVTDTMSVSGKDETAPALNGTWPEDITGQDNCFANADTIGLKDDSEIKSLYEDCSGITVTHEDANTLTDDCGWTITRTYTIKDACGNTVTPAPAMSVSGRDQTAPVLAEEVTWPDNITNQDNCFANAVTSGLYTDDQVKALYSDCSTITVTHEDANTLTDNCGWTITRTYTIKDACNNTVTKTMSVSGKDQTAPALTGTWPANITDQDNCLANADISGLYSNEAVKALYTDCSAITVSHEDATTGDDCGWTITRTYTITDACGKTSTNSMSVSGSDQTAPELTGTWPTNITGQDNCLANADISGLYSNDQVKALYSDCSALTVTSRDTVTGDDCGWTVTRTYTITDACNNSVTDTMSVSGSDQTDPELTGTWPENIIGQDNCFAAADISDLLSDDDVKALYSDCSTITVTHTDANILTDDCGWTITRTYTIKDACGNTVTPAPAMSVSGSDQTAPALNGTWPANITNQDNCFANADISGLYSNEAVKALYSDCSTITVTHTDANTLTDDCGWTITRTYTIKDACNNTVTPAPTMSVSGSDKTAPVLTGTWPTNITGQDNCFANAVTSGLYTDDQVKALYSDCSTITVTHSDANTLTDDCGWTITRTYTIKDACGNTVTPAPAMSVSGSDQTAPALNGTWPDNITGQDNCFANADISELLSNDDVKALYSDCSTITVTHEDANTLTDNCGWTITRTYTIKDACNNSVTKTMSVSGSDQTAPALTGTWPTNIIGQDNCFANADISGLLSDNDVKALYSDCSTITVTHTDANTLTDDCGWTITRAYTIKDACGNTVTPAPAMSVSGSDQTAPVLAGTWPSDSTGQNSCLTNADTTGLKDDSEIKALYSDCSTITVTHTDTIEGNACGWTVTRTYTIKDACGNTVSPAPTMSVSGSDQTAPVIESINLDRTLTSTNCVFTIPDMREIVRNISTDCSEITVTQPSAGMVVYPMTEERDTTVNVIVTDSCGNSSVKEVVITIPAKVTISATATPATICYGATSQLTATPSNVVGTATYNWTPSDGLNNATIASPVATLTTTTTYTVEVTDGNGCAATATTTVNVNPEVVMDTVAPMTLCVGDVTSYSFTTPLTVGTMSYAWTNSNTAIGLAASGNGNLPSFTPTNTTNAPINATIAVTPSHTYNDIICVGDPINFTITVRPSIKTPGNVTFSCPADTTVVLSYSDCEQLVNIGEPEFVNHMSGMTVNITNDAPAGNIFPEGTTIVTWTATDDCGDTLTCTQNVVIQFPPCGDTIADFDGYRYSSVRIGCQCWTGENARSEHYSDGTPVDNFRYYNDSDSLENIYGKLYTWYTAVRVPEGDNNAEPSISTDPFGTPYVQGICPEGWALPTVNEYMLMIANSGDATHAKDGSNLYWLPGYEGQPPFSGFDAYGAGKYNGAIDRYQELLGKTHFWTTLSGSGSETATTVEINYYCAEGLQTELSKGDGVSIRCIRKR